MFLRSTLINGIKKIPTFTCKIQQNIKINSSYHLSPLLFSTNSTEPGPFVDVSNGENPHPLEEDYKVEIADVTKAAELRQRNKQSKIGEVVSTKNAKTITVKVKHLKFYSKYNAYYPRTKKFMAHDEEEKAKDGDIVRIGPSRPMSRRKRHKLLDIIHRPAKASALKIENSLTASSIDKNNTAAVNSAA